MNNSDYNVSDCFPKPLIKHEPVDDLVVQWYATVSHEEKPHGFYFYTNDESWCFGPYLTQELAESGFRRWMSGKQP